MSLFPSLCWCASAFSPPSAPSNLAVNHCAHPPLHCTGLFLLWRSSLFPLCLYLTTFAFELLSSRRCHAASLHQPPILARFHITAPAISAHQFHISMSLSRHLIALCTHAPDPLICANCKLPPPWCWSELLFLVISPPSPSAEWFWWPGRGGSK